MSAAALVAQLAAAGTPPELLAAVAQELFSAEAERRVLAERRENERTRKARSRDNTGRHASSGDGRGPLNESNSKPSDSPVEANASTTPQRRNRGQAMPADWKPPEIETLSEKARECASKWPAGRYETEAEGFVAFWVNDGRRRPDWRLTWIGWVIRIHNQVMRDARFAKPDPPSLIRPGKRLTARDLQCMIAFAEDHGDPERAAELRQKLRELQPPADPNVARLVGQTTQGLRVAAR